MLQQFYKDTLQSQYIKYILNNFPIPTVPFTSNIMHVTKGNTYIHDGYFVTAKKSTAIAIIEEDISENKSAYSTYFKKGEPYIFGEYYNGLTTTYKSNTKGYDSTSHYYLGEYLRAYKAYYNIDLMPFYNCYSNEYIDYVFLDKNEKGEIVLKEKKNPNYSIISVPIKFCQNYTIALQCNSEVRMMPAFVGKKGILQVKTSELSTLKNWGKSFPRIDFKSPVFIESPHINSINDTIQSALQAYDKYLRLLIQIPVNTKTSIAVLEGKYQNSKPFQQKIFNTSKNDVSGLWDQPYNTKVPSDRSIELPKKSTMNCFDLSKQKIFLYKDNPIFSIGNYIDGNGSLTGSKIDFKFTVDSTKIGNDLTVSHWNNDNRLIKSIYFYSIGKDENGNNILKIPTNFLCGEFNKFFDEHKNIKYSNIKIDHPNIKYNNNTYNGGLFPIELNNNFTFTFENDISWDTFSTDDTVTVVKLASACNDSTGRNAIRQLVAVKEGENGYSIWACELAFYLNSEKDLIIDSRDSKLVKFEVIAPNPTPGKSIIEKDRIQFKFNEDYKYIQMSPNYPQESAQVWDLEFLKSSISDINFFSKYLNQNLISDLSLLYCNNELSYAFSDRLIEYLTNSVISSNEKIPKNISRVQRALGLPPTDIYNENLRVEVYNKVKEKSKLESTLLPDMVDKSLIKDINGFLDKDSENFLNILN